MITGTTPTHNFYVGLDTSIITKGRVIYAQNGEIVLKKEISQDNCDKDKISIDLTQEDTFLFKNEGKVNIRIRALTIDGNVIATDEIKVDVELCLDNEVLK